MLRAVLVGLLALVVVLALSGVWLVRRSFPIVDGERSLAALDAPVEVIRDPAGVPHIYAATTADLFRAQGYVHAQDRFWQMDVFRHIGAGRMAELFGDSQVDTDRFLRTLGWRRVAEREWPLLRDETRAALEAYAEGVNAYLGERSGSGLSFEYVILGLTNRGYEPEPWEPLDSLTWLKVMAWDLRSNLEEEIERAVLAATMPRERVDELWPDYPAEHPAIFEDGHVVNGRFVTGPGVTGAGARVVQVGATDKLERLGRFLKRLDGTLGPPGDGLGSNNWVVAGSRTASGAPLLANDPHLGPQLPSIWYQVGLHCRPVAPDCAYEAAGFSFAGSPGIVIGHNARIAWGFTNLGHDVMDLYIERLDPQDPDRYEVNGGFDEMEIVEERIAVAGGEPVTHRVRLTRHGPVLSDVSDQLARLDAGPGLELPERWAVALRWTALDPDRTADAIFLLNEAGNWEEFREALRYFAVPAQNVVYADVDGHIGYQAPGRVPIRASGDGRWPVPGWTDDHEWTRSVPFEELPSVLDPPSGYVMTANNALVRDDYPHLLSRSWNYGFRAQRLRELLTENTEGLDVDDMAAMQAEAENLLARRLVPVLLDLDLDGDAVAARDLLREWDGQQTRDSAGAAVFNATWRAILARTFHDELPESHLPSGASRWWAVVGGLVGDPDSPWWDDISTPEREGRDAILTAAVEDAATELEEVLGPDPTRWRWGDLHVLTLEHQTLGKSGIAPIERLFNRGGFRLAGGQETVDATSWSAPKGYEVDWVPSMRMVIDLGDFDGSTAIDLTGQSGHAFHRHYVDRAARWANHETEPMRWSRERVELDDAATLHLVPWP